MRPYWTFTGKFSEEALWHNIKAARILRLLRDASVPASDRFQVTNAGIRPRLYPSGIRNRPSG